jgi:phage baseplate assembly protein W
MITLNNIKSSDWSLSLAGQGQIVEELADIGQCILIIATSQKRSDPMRPEFGCDILQWLDKPVNQMVAGLVKEVAEAVSIWETRAIITRIRPTVAGENVTVSIEWKTATGLTGETVVNYGR